MKNKVLLYSGIALILFLIISPFYLQKDAEFAGADGQAGDVIMEIDPDYEPWFESIIEPASGEIESLLFCLQAALGAGFIGYYLGYKKGEKKKETAS